MPRTVCAYSFFLPAVNFKVSTIFPPVPMFYSTIPGKTPFTKLGSTPMFEVSIVNKLNCYLFSVPI